MPALGRNMEDQFRVIRFKLLIRKILIDQVETQTPS